MRRTLALALAAAAAVTAIPGVLEAACRAAGTMSAVRARPELIAPYGRPSSPRVSMCKDSVPAGRGPLWTAHHAVLPSKSSP